MKNFKKIISIVLILSFFITIVPIESELAQASGGISVTKNSNAEELAKKLVGSEMPIRNAIFSGKSRQAGFFSDSGVTGIEEGVILSSGHIKYAKGPNTSRKKSYNNGRGGDETLDLFTGKTTYDAAVLQFEFKPQEEYLAFQYVFSSDEYEEYVDSWFNDAFAFLVNGKNAAIIPESEEYVSINTVNHKRNTEYYKSNHRKTTYNTEMDGLTTVLKAYAKVDKGDWNTIRLVVADATDQIYDSNVFLKANSFKAVADPEQPMPPNINVSTTEWTHDDVTVTIDYFDANIKQVYYNGNWHDYTGPFTISSNQTIHAIGYNKNRVGVVRESKEVTKDVGNIDKEKPGAPIIDINKSVAAEVSVEYPSTLSGLKTKKIYYNGEWHDYQGPVTIKSTQEIKAKSKSNSGLSSDISSANIDVEIPVADVTIQVTDAAGAIQPEFQTSKGSEDTEIIEQIDAKILKGDAVAGITIEGDTLKTKSYQFVEVDNTSDVPQFPTTGWIDLGDTNVTTVENNTFEAYPDLMQDKNGYLSVKHYDYSGNHSTREITFGNPTSDGVVYQRAEVDSNNRYNYEDGTPIFFGNSYVTLNHKNTTSELHNDGFYKATKMWGYLAPKKSGTYKLGAYSDDGAYGYLTIDGEKQEFVNDWQIRAAFNRTNNKEVELVAGNVYPLYMEWYEGCWSHKAFIPRYRLNNSGWKDIPKDWFYSSSDDTPGVVNTAYFETSTLDNQVKFPNETGIYYIAIKTVNEKDIVEAERKVLYGPFINDKTPPELSIDTIMEDNIIDESEKSNVQISGTVDEDSYITLEITDGTATTSSAVSTLVNGDFSVDNIDVSNLSDGILTVKVTAEDVAGNITEEIKTVEKVTSKPTINNATLDEFNAYIDVEFSEAVYGDTDGSTPISISDFNVIHTTSDGSIVGGAAIDSITKTDNSVLTGGETEVRVYIDLSREPKDGDKVEIKVKGVNEVFNSFGTAMNADETTGKIELNVLAEDIEFDSGLQTKIMKIGRYKVKGNFDLNIKASDIAIKIGLSSSSPDISLNNITIDSDNVLEVGNEGYIKMVGDSITSSSITFNSSSGMSSSESAFNLYSDDSIDAGNYEFEFEFDIFSPQLDISTPKSVDIIINEFSFDDEEGNKHTFNPSNNKSIEIKELPDIL